MQIDKQVRDTFIATAGGVVTGACALAVLIEVPALAAGAGALVLTAAAVKRLSKCDDNKE